MNVDELLQHAKCSICNQPIGHSQVPFFWVATVERHGLNLSAIKRFDALFEMLGSRPLVEALGPDVDFTIPLLDPVQITICEKCMMEHMTLLADLALSRLEKD